jgi:transcriptional regulator with XRE-family HTH domain
MAREDRAPEGGRQWAATIAANIRYHRRVREWSQAEVAERMGVLGYPWSRATVSDVERSNRDLTVDEIAALAIVLGEPPLTLLDPLGARPEHPRPLRFGVERPFALNVYSVPAWFLGRERIWLDRAEDGSWTLDREMGTVPRDLEHRLGDGEDRNRSREQLVRDTRAKAVAKALREQPSDDGAEVDR